MNQKKLVVITEGGRTLGFGHITRATSLVSNFLLYGYSVNFILNADKSVLNIISFPYEIFDWREEKKLLFEKVKEYSLILLDSILIEDNQIKELESLNIPIIFIDDEKQRNILEKGFVVDWTILRNETNSFKNRKKKVHYFLGSKYIPLRKEFYKKDVKTNLINKKLSKIMISFGGSDIRNLTPMILDLLNDNFPNIKKDVIIGAGFDNIEEIKKHSTSNTNLITYASAKDMINSMETSDIAISAGGQTLYELAKIGIPTIGILLVENAKADTLGWEKTGFLKFVGRYNEKSLKENIINEIKNLSIYENRLRSRECALKHMPRNGGKLLVKEIIKILNDTF